MHYYLLSMQKYWSVKQWLISRIEKENKRAPGGHSITKISWFSESTSFLSCECEKYALTYIYRLFRVSL